MKKDQIVGIGAILAAAFFFYHTQSIRVSATLIEPGPRLMPYIAEALLAICGAGMVWESATGRQQDEVFLDRDGQKRLGKALLLLAAYAVGLTVVGFIWATPFMAFVLIQMLSGGKKIRITTSILVSIAITAVLYLIFAKGFRVGLPKGMF